VAAFTVSRRLGVAYSKDDGITILRAKFQACVIALKVDATPLQWLIAQEGAIL
jgi:hypothetical protein